MNSSARNKFFGTVANVRAGAVNDEIDVKLDSGTMMTAIITNASTKNLGLAPGKKVVALVKASWVILMTDADGVKFSARNQFSGKVSAVRPGAVNAEIEVKLEGGEELVAIITEESRKGLKLESGSQVTALIKASHVIIGAVE